MNLEGRVAIVTGAGGGIGSETARALAEAGARVVLAGPDDDDLARATREIAARGHEAVAHPVDVTEEASVESLVRFTSDRFGRVDVVDNNAGATTFTHQDVDVTSMTVALWDEIMAINARGPMLVCKHAIPAMLANGGGSIVNISSGLSLAGDLGSVAYAASKAALNSLTRSVATLYGDRGIRCNAIAVGLIRTPAMEATMPEPLQAIFEKHLLIPRLGRPRDIADMVVFLASDLSAYVTGQTISVDGGFFAKVPTVPDVRELLARMLEPKTT